MVRKILPEYENPIDDVIIHLADKTDGVYKYFNLTPNHLTTLALLFGIMTAYYIYKGYNKLATLTFFLSYYYDCMDGNYARKYNMVTNFGDYYDHIVDWFKFALILFAMYKKNPKKFKYILILSAFLSLSVIHIGCQERMSHLNHVQPILDHFEFLCPNDDFIHISKWFGTGTANLIMAIAIYTY